MRLGRPRYRKTKSKSFLGGLIRFAGTVSKTKGRPWRATGSTKIGPYGRNTRGDRWFSFFGIRIPIEREEDE